MDEPTIAEHEIIEDSGEKWVYVKYSEIAPVTFSLNEDGSLYLLQQDGSAMQDTESDFQDRFSDEEWYERHLKRLNQLVMDNY